MSNENKALELWRQWFEFSGVPWELDMDNIDLSCFFCGERKDHGHAKDCVYVQAAELLHTEWMGKINDECSIYSTAIKKLEEMREAEKLEELEQQLEEHFLTHDQWVDPEQVSVDHSLIHKLKGRISKACTSAVLEVLRDQHWRYKYETRYSNSG